MTIPKPVNLGRPLWWVHLSALCWHMAGTAMLYFDMVHEAAMCFAACLTTATPLVLYLFGYLEQSPGRAPTRPGAPEGPSRADPPPDHS